MRIDDPIFSGSVVGSDAVVSLSGSFTGSGTIENANTASKLLASASFGLGMEAFNFDGSTNQTISIDTSSAHFISGALAALSPETGSFVTTASISGLTQSFTKGDGSTFEINLPDTGAVDLTFEITGGLGIEPFTFDNTANAQVQVDTSSAHFRTGVSSSIADLFTGSVTLNDAEVSGSFTGSMTGDLTGTASLASKVDNSLDQGLGIETFSYDGGTAGIIVQVDTSSAHIAGLTGSTLITASLTSTTMSFTKGDGSTFDLNLPTGDTSSLVITSSISGLTQSFTKGDGSTYTNLLPETGSFITTASYSTGSIGQTVNTMSFTKGDGSTFEVHISNSVVSVTPSTVSNLLAIGYEDGTTVSSPVISSSHAVSADAARRTINTLNQGLGIETFSFDGETSGILVQLDTSSAHFTTGVSASQASTLTALSSSLAADSSTDSASLAASITSLSSSAAAALTAQSASDAVNFVSQPVYDIQTGSFVTTASISGLTQSFTKGDGSTFEINLPDTGSPTLSNQITGGLGVDPFTFNGTADAQVQLNTSSAHFLDPINAATASLSASASTSRDGIANAVSGAFDAVSASLAGDITTNSSSAATANTNLSSSASTARESLSGSASTARDAIVANISGAFQATSASFSTSQTNLSASNSTAREAYVSGGALLAGREEDTIRLTRGNGSVDDVTFVTSSFVKSVNTITPDAAGNVAIAIASVETGISSSGNFPASGDDGDVFIVSGETGSNTGSNGKAFIYSTASAQWFEISNLDQVENDLRYVQVAGDTMTGNLVLPAANPTLANQATRKGYVDLFYDSSSLDRVNAELELHKGDNVTVDIISLSGITVSGSVSASYLSQANGVRIESTTNANQNYIIVNDGASNAEIAAANNLELNMNTDGGAIGQIDFQNNGTSVATIDQDGTASFAFVASTASSALSVEHRLNNGLGIESFFYDGDLAGKLVQLDTSSAHFNTGVSESIADLFTGSIRLNDAEVSGSFTGSAVGNITGTASLASKVDNSLDQGLGIETFSYDGGTAGIIVQVNTGSNHFQVGVSESIADLFTGSIRLNDAEVSGSFTGSMTGNLTGTASIVPHSASEGVAIVPFKFDGSEHAVISVDTASQAFADGVAIGLSSASFAGLSIDFSGSNLSFTDANFSGSTFNFSGSTLDLSGAVIYANTASFSGSFNYSGSSITSASIEAATFTGSSAFTGAFDFSNATVTGLAIAPNYAPTTQSADFTAVAGRAYIVTQSSAAITMSLPATPTNGDSIKIANMDDRANLIARNGERIMGVAEDMTLNVEQVSFELIYEDSPNMGWVIFGARAIT